MINHIWSWYVWRQWYGASGNIHPYDHGTCWKELQATTGLTLYTIVDIPVCIQPAIINVRACGVPLTWLRGAQRKTSSPDRIHGFVVAVGVDVAIYQCATTHGRMWKASWRQSYMTSTLLQWLVQTPSWIGWMLSAYTYYMQSSYNLNYQIFVYRMIAS
jgi:hypothetical protein